VKHWDYIIVGAGSAGCVLAERLSAGGKASVLVLEAGGDDRNPLIHMPKGMAKLVMDPKHTWYFPIAQPRVEGEAASETWVRGLGLGGSSSINGMIYVRGHPDDYAEWVARGATGWGWDTMKGAFRALEDHELGDDGLRGVGGPVHVGVNRFRYPVSEALLAAGREMGLPDHGDDLNREDQEGVGYYVHNIRAGVPAPGDATVERPRDHTCSRRSRDVRFAARNGRRRHRRRHATDVHSCARGARLGRRTDVAGDPAALGDRRRRVSAGTRHRRAG
jgi:choline dehydrogenase-like flavoprotein